MKRIDQSQFNVYIDDSFKEQKTQKKNKNNNKKKKNNNNISINAQCQLYLEDTECLDLEYLLQQVFFPTYPFS